MALDMYQSDQLPARPLRSFVYGQPGTGKTHFGGTFPKPVFLSAGPEGGDTTLRHMPGVTVITINSTNDMKEAVALIEHQHQHYGWQSVVVDSVTFYADVVISEITKGTAAMRQRDWGTLDIHLQKWLLPVLHRLPLHVLWIALEQEKAGGDGVIKTIPMLYGKTAVKLPATSDLLLHAEVIQVAGADNQMETKFIMRTRAWAGAIARDRFGTAFASGYIEPNFDYIAARVGQYIGAQPATPQ